MNVSNSNLEDINEILRLYDLATEFQKIKFPNNQWPKFEKNLIINEVNENRQFKIVINSKIACVWAITFNDDQIWENSKNDAALYIHRIATNPEFRGNNFVKTIVNWSLKFAHKKKKHFIRMDTCGRNEYLINHYKKCGFTYLGLKKLKDTSKLPSHYHNAEVCFFEIKL
jgi:predicted GNAT family N-acyltransferase